MKQISKMLTAAGIGYITLFAACKKSNDTTTISKPPYQIGQAVSDASPLSGSIKGTMLTGKTYTVNGDVIVNAGDTLLLQPGTTVNVTATASITIKGVFLSLGTSSQPNWVTVPGIAKQDAISPSVSSDPAFLEKWYGINCDTACALFVMKWTHVEFCGATVATPPVSGLGT